MITLAALALSSPAHARKPRHTNCRTKACAIRVGARQRAAEPMQNALASWYEDAGPIACNGGHKTLGVAHRSLPCGTQIWMCAARCATVTVEDRGPFISGRDWDLNASAKARLGCGDLCTVRYRIE